MVNFNPINNIKVIVRRASNKDKDVNQVLYLIRQAHKESSLRQFVLKEDAIRKILSVESHHKHIAVWLMYDTNDPVNAVGVCAVQVVSDAWVDRHYVEDFILYIKPRYRGRKFSHRFLSTIDIWVRNSEYPISYINLHIPSGNKESAQAYARAGFKPSQHLTMYKKVL